VRQDKLPRLLLKVVILPERGINNASAASAAVPFLVVRHLVPNGSASIGTRHHQLTTQSFSGG
jgi:hypothetical protein